jgi:hypothetical protein
MNDDGAYPMNRVLVWLTLAMIILIVPASYVASYCLLADHRIGGTGAMYPHYRVGGDRTRKLYWPMEWLDRNWRARND